jgi:hypothetical protein
MSKRKLPPALRANADKLKKGEKLGAGKKKKTTRKSK